MKKSVFFFVVLCLSGLSSNSYARHSEPQTMEEKIALVLQQIRPPEAPAHTIHIKKPGGRGDSVTDCRPVFEKAFAQAKKHKGAKIVVGPGIWFLNGPLHLVSDICIELQKGSRLKFTDDPQRYLPAVLTSWEGTLCYNYSPLIYARQLQNISIIGEGTIDGNAALTFSTWKAKQSADQALSRRMNNSQMPVNQRIFGEGHFLRPHLIQFLECKNILMEGVTVTNSPFWCIHLVKSENATFRGINFIAKLVNNDGINPEYSKNILIENISFDNGDDNVAIKAGRDTEGRLTATPSENIVIRNCRFKGLHGVVIGSEMSAGVQNVFVIDCTYGGYLKRGIFLKSNADRGGFIRNIYIKNVEFGEVEDCFFITSNYHGEGKGHTTDIHDVYVENVRCGKAVNAGIVIQGYAGKPVRDIYFKNVMIDEAKLAVSLPYTRHIVMENVHIGGVFDAAPSHAQ